MLKNAWSTSQITQQRFFQVSFLYGLIFLDKSYLMNVVNTLDPGLILKTFKSLQKSREE